jgi:CheY-like chemotaxis protein
MDNLGPLNEDDTRDKEQAGLAQFIAINSHQLRQPMYAMNLYLATLNTFDLPETMRVVFDNLRQCAGFLDEIFLSILDLACLHANAVEQKFEQFPIVSVLLHVKNEFMEEAKTKGVEFNVAPSSAWVTSDLTLVKKMLSALTAEAIRFANSGKLLIGCRRKGRNLRVAIYNSGNKLTAHHSVLQSCETDQLWGDPIEGLDSASIGLILARELGQQLAAPLAFNSLVGRGSVISFELPILKPRAIEVVVPLPSFSGDVLAHKIIVVVDDDENILNATRMLLDRWQCSVITANSCNGVLEKLNTLNRPPDALICDYRLEKKETGLDIIRLLRAEFNQNIPALLITGENISKVTEEALAMGVHALHKPLQVERLYETLQRALMAFSI